MKKRIAVMVFLLGISFTVLAQVKRTAAQIATETKETNSPPLRTQAPEGHYCD